MNTIYKDLLDETIGSEPPSRWDLDSLVAEVKSRSHRQQWTAAGTFAAVVSVLGLAVGLLPNQTAPREPGAEPSAAAPMTTAPPRPKPTLAGLPPTEPPSVARVRLGAAMRASVLRAAPGAVPGGSFDVHHLGWDSSLTQDGESYAPRYSFQARQTITVGGVQGVISIAVKRTDDSYACLVPLPPGSIKSCGQGPGPNGELVIVQHLVDEDASGALLRTIVRVERRDGSSVWVVISNETRVPDGSRPMVYTGKSPPLSVAQLTAIALDPTLTIYP